MSDYRQELEAVRHRYGGTRKLPPVAFFLFGMGSRQKLVYMDGQLRDARTGQEVRRWDVSRDLIVPPAYTVVLETRQGDRILIREDENGVWLHERGQRRALCRGHVGLPQFNDHRFGSVLRVLHQELLVNVVDGLPVPNFFVYPKPWYRDGAMMAMALRQTGNVALIADWIRGLREPYDRNNREDEADNLGQALYLISLVSDRSHPLVPVLQKELKRFQKRDYIEGRCDSALHPVYQTKWAKFGLAALGLQDPYRVPDVADSYATLFWWNDRRADRPGKKVIQSDNYPYLTWAGSHDAGIRLGKLSDRDYPLTWEAKASQADYAGMKVIAPVYADQRLCAPHTWHAAEAFLYLLEDR